MVRNFKKLDEKWEKYAYYDFIIDNNLVLDDQEG